jgi:hypothetical protein
MAHTLRPLSLGQLLDETFNIYRRNFLLFLGISAIPNLALLLLQLALAGTAFNDAKSNFAIAAFAGLAAAFASLFVDAIVTAATTFGVSDIYLDRPTSIAACFSRVTGKALRVIYVSFITSLIVGFGFALCIAPGVYFAGKYGIAIPAVVLENITGNQALKRSANLTDGFVGRVVVVYFLTYFFVWAMTIALNTALRSLGSVAFHDSGIFSKQAFDAIVSTFGGILFGPVTAIGLTLAYYDQRVRREAFDIEHMMRLMTPPESLASEASVS